MLLRFWAPDLGYGERGAAEVVAVVKGMPGGGFLEQGAAATRTVASLALVLVSTALRPAEEELLEVFLIGGQAVFEAVHGSLVTLTGFQPAEAAATGTQGASTCRDTQGQLRSPSHPRAQLSLNCGDQGLRMAREEARSPLPSSSDPSSLHPGIQLLQRS